MGGNFPVSKHHRPAKSTQQLVTRPQRQQKHSRKPRLSPVPAAPDGRAALHFLHSEPAAARPPTGGPGRQEARVRVRSYQAHCRARATRTRRRLTPAGHGSKGAGQAGPLLPSVHLAARGSAPRRNSAHPARTTPRREPHEAALELPQGTRSTHKCIRDPGNTVGARGRGAGPGSARPPSNRSLWGRQASCSWG